ncbi:hypothetical protein ACTMU2_32235 [Cupriavidus basilensis]
MLAKAGRDAAANASPSRRRLHGRAHRVPRRARRRGGRPRADALASTNGCCCPLASPLARPASTGRTRRRPLQWPSADAAVFRFRDDDADILAICNAAHAAGMAVPCSAC